MKAWKIALLFSFAANNACKSPNGESTAPASSIKGEEELSEGEDGFGGNRPPQLFRFDPWMDSLRNSIENDPNAGPDQVAARIVDGPTRISAFNLQGLCRLYGDEDELFGKMRDDFKDLEDVIGGFDKWTNVLKNAKKNNKPPNIIKKLEKNQREATEEIKRLLVDRKWVRDSEGETRVQKIQRKLDEFDWKKPKKDRLVMLDRLIEELKDIDKIDYQFKTLEEGNGLHELRRNLRWVSIEMRVLNGMIIFENHPEQCPASEFKDLINQPIAQSKYSQLPPSEAEQLVCKIPQCLYLGMAEMIEGFGEIKDGVEADVNSQDSGNDHDEVPKEARKKAEKLYERMKKSKLISELKDDLKRCLNDF